MTQDFYAHSDPDGRLPDEEGARWHKLSDHLTATAEKAREFAKPFGAGDWAYLAGLLHDLGKYRIEFQQYLRKGRSSGIDTYHAVYGSAAACQRFNLDTASFAIAGHHSGLHNASDLNEILLGNKYSAINRYPELLNLLEKEIGKIVFTTSTLEDKYHNLLQYEFLTRMVFSVLIDADRLNSEEWEKSMLLGKPWKRFICNFHADCLMDRLMFAKNEKSRNKPKDDLNRFRNSLFEKCIHAGLERQGFFSLTVPTGGGKTISSMAFALSHAKKHNLRRIIVVIPYLSIIEQNAKEYRDIFGEGQVLEHHCAVEIPLHLDNNGNEEPSESSLFEKAMENWDMPIIVTTSVQFIETLFSNKPRKARKLHNISRSVVIFDEVQTMPVHLLNPTLDILRNLKDYFGVSFVFCSATQPAFRKSANVTCGFDSDEIHEITPEPRKMYEKLQRVQYQIESPDDKWSWQHLAGNMLAKQQCLTIVNLRKHALQIYSELRNQIEMQRADMSGVFHLSSAMCPAHRLDILGLSKMPPINNIKVRLTEGKSCWVVSTQLIEAGVDIDFPVVFRAIGPLDSIVQSAGRCNREGRLHDEKGNPINGEVIVFYPEDNGIPPGIYQTATNITPSYLQCPEKLSMCPEIFGKYFTELYQLRPTDYSRQGKHLIQEDRQRMNFKSVAEHAKVIEDNTVPIVVPYGSSEKFVENIRKSKRFDRNSLRTLQRFMVNVRHYQRSISGKPSDYNRLYEAGAIVPLIPERLEIPVLEPRNGCKYSSEFGLVIDELTPEDLIA